MRGSLTIRRIGVWVISMLLGAGVGFLMIYYLLPALSPDPNAENVDVPTFGILYFLTMVIPLGLIFMTWLDYFMDTKIWPD